MQEEIAALIASTPQADRDIMLSQLLSQIPVSFSLPTVYAGLEVSLSSVERTENDFLNWLRYYCIIQVVWMNYRHRE